MSARSGRGGRVANPWNSRTGGSRVNSRGRGTYASDLSSQRPGPTAEEKFRQAQQSQQAAIQRHLVIDEDSDSSEDDNFPSHKDRKASGDNSHAGAILEGMLTKYQSHEEPSQGGTADLSSLGRTFDHLSSALTAGGGGCLVCLEKIRREDPVWSCQACYCMMHMQCIQTWVKDGCYQKKSANAAAAMFKREEVPWHCPKCRHEYSQSESPTKYYCFCGQAVDPANDPWVVPHSCGQTCDKPLLPACGHRCLLLCHPGPCPPCPKVLRVRCHCGQGQDQPRRCGNQAWSCGAVCGRPLSCGQHRCSDICHLGECQPCPRESVQKCLCGKVEETKKCAESVWQCDKVCLRKLSCGSHLCERACHKGSCGPCPRAVGDRRCPCGKTRRGDLPCTEDVPPCGDTCAKTLACGVHTCMQKCHPGNCGQCREMISKACRCGAKHKELPCYKDYTCETRCPKTRGCGVHACHRRCCDGQCPPCEQRCGKTLNCKQHKCSSNCHTGPCYPCPLTVSKSCNCGATTRTVPCGRGRTTEPPTCLLCCRKPPDCHHERRRLHRCHFGDCPPCKQICGCVLPNCSHTCPHRCHTAVRTVIQDTTTRAGPWEPLPAARVELVDHSCPPCQVPVPYVCLGGHESSTLPCSEMREVSCGRPCGRKLACANHSCRLQCHKVEDKQQTEIADVSCPSCEEGCSLPRPEGCTHQCTRPCHPAGSCPPCKRLVSIKCHCSLALLHVECVKLTSANKEEAARATLLSCQGKCPKELSCKHTCGLDCHPGPCRARCKKKTPVRCPCKRKKASYLCCDVTEGSAKLECDSDCKEALRQEQEVARQKAAQEAEEAAEKQRKELEQFERSMRGRQRKPRKQPAMAEPPPTPWWKRYGPAGLGCLLAVGLAVYAAWLVSL